MKNMMRVVMVALMAACAGCAGEPPKMEMTTEIAPRMKMTTEVPPGVATPDKLETSLGTLILRRWCA